MTSEPDSKPGRRPPTIELKATEVGKPGCGECRRGPDAPGARSSRRSEPPQPHKRA